MVFSNTFNSGGIPDFAADYSPRTAACIPMKSEILSMFHLEKIPRP